MLNFWCARKFSRSHVVQVHAEKAPFLTGRLEVRGGAAVVVAVRGAAGAAVWMHVFCSICLFAPSGTRGQPHLSCQTCKLRRCGCDCSCAAASTRTVGRS